MDVTYDMKKIITPTWDPISSSTVDDGSRYCRVKIGLLLLTHLCQEIYHKCVFMELWRPKFKTLDLKESLSEVTIELCIDL